MSLDGPKWGWCHLNRKQSKNCGCLAKKRDRDTLLILVSFPFARNVEARIDHIEDYDLFFGPHLAGRNA